MLPATSFGTLLVPTLVHGPPPTDGVLPSPLDFPRIFTPDFHFLRYRARLTPSRPINSYPCRCSRGAEVQRRFGKAFSKRDLPLFLPLFSFCSPPFFISQIFPTTPGPVATVCHRDSAASFISFFRFRNAKSWEQSDRSGHESARSPCSIHGLRDPDGRANHR